MKRRRERGHAVMLVTVAMSLVMLGGFGLVLDGSQLYAHREMAQAAADSAAEAGMMSIYNSTNIGTNAFGSTSFNCTTATDVRTPCVYARANGFGATANDTISIEFPSTVSGVNLSSADVVAAMRVTVSRTVKTSLMRLIGTSSATIKATATSAIVALTSPSPIIVTHPSLASAFALNGGITVTICGGPNRSIQVNSSNPLGISTSGNGVVDLSHAGAADLAGDCTAGTGGDFGDYGGPSSYPGNLTLGSTGTYIQPASPVADPLADLVQPSAPATNGTTSTATAPDCGCPSGTCTLYRPGLYNSGITVKNDFALFAPGLYYISGGGFNMNSNSGAQMATLPCTVTPAIAIPDATYNTGIGMVVFNTGTGANDIFNFTSNAGSKGGVSLAGDTNFTTYKGVLFFEDRTAAGGSTHTHSIQGGGTIALTGNIYINKTNQDATHYQLLSIQGNAGSTTTLSGDIIASVLNLGGNASITMKLNPIGPLSARRVALVR